MTVEAWIALGALTLALVAALGASLSWVHGQISSVRTDYQAEIAKERTTIEALYARREDMATLTARFDAVERLLREVRDDVHRLGER